MPPDKSGDNKIDLAQRDITKERDKGDAAEYLKKQIRDNEVAFFILVDKYQDLAKDINIKDKEVLVYWENQKTWISDTLKTVAADGKWINEHQGALPAGSEDLQTRIKKSNDITEIGNNFKSDLDREIQAVTTVAELVEKQRIAKTAVEDFEKLESQPATKKEDLLVAADKILFDPGTGLTSLDKETDRVTKGKSDTLMEIPQGFLAYTLRQIPKFQKILVELTIKAIIEKEYPGKVIWENGGLTQTPEGEKMKTEEVQAMLLKLGAVKHNIEFTVALRSAPEGLEGYYRGMAAFESGNLEEARKLLEPYTKMDKERVPTSPFDSETDFKNEAQKALDSIKELTNKNEKFFKAQELINNGRIVEAKAMLQEYLLQSEEKGADQQKKNPNFRATAKELLKRISLVQLDQFRAEFKKIKKPEEQKPMPEGQPVNAQGVRVVGRYEVPAFAQASLQYARCEKALKDMETGILAGEYNFGILFEKVGSPNFALLGMLDFEDLATIEKDRKQGSLELARKYRKDGNYAKAREYFMMYFGDQIQENTKDNFSFYQFKHDFVGNAKLYLPITKIISDKINEQNAELKLHNHQPLTEEQKLYLHGQILDESIAKAYPNALLRYQNSRFISDKVVMGSEVDQKIWQEEFMNMEGLHKQSEGANAEVFALSDTEWDELANTIAINVPILIASAFTAGAAGGVARGFAYAATRTAATEAARDVGYFSVARVFGAYGASLLVENAVFSGSNMFFRAVRTGDFSTMNMATFSDEWHSGLVMLAGLGQVSKVGGELAITSKLAKGATAGEKIAYGAKKAINAGSSLSLELSFMGAESGKVDLNTLATVLGLKLSHGFKNAEEVKGLPELQEKIRVKSMLEDKALTFDTLNVAEFQKLSPDAQKFITNELARRQKEASILDTIKDKEERSSMQSLLEDHKLVFDDLDPVEFEKLSLEAQKAIISILSSRNAEDPMIESISDPEEIGLVKSIESQSLFSLVDLDFGKFKKMSIEAQRAIAIIITRRNPGQKSAQEFLDGILLPDVIENECLLQQIGGKPGGDYFELINPSTQRPWTSHDKIVYLQKLIGERTKTLDLDTDNPEIHKKVLELAQHFRAGEVWISNSGDLLSKNRFWLGQFDHKVTRVITDSQKLPKGWEKSILGETSYSPDKNFILEIESPDGSKKYKIIHAQDIYVGNEFESTHALRDLFGASKTNEGSPGATLIKDISGQFKKQGGRNPLWDVEKHSENDVSRRMRNIEREFRDRKFLTKEERANLVQDIAKLRELIQQKQQVLAQIHASIEKFIRENAGKNITEIELMSQFDNEALEKVFTTNEIQRIKNTALELMKKSKVIQRFYETYKQNPRELFWVLFGKYPKGSVDLIKTDFSLGFECFLESDYFEAGGAKGSAGVSLGSGSVQIEGLNGVVTLINNKRGTLWNRQEIIDHEERHNINRFVFSGLGTKSHAPFENFTKASSEKQLRHNYDRHLKQTLTNARDEILAYMSEGVGKYQLTSILTNKNGLYNYWGNYIKKYLTPTAVAPMSEGEGKVADSPLNPTKIDALTQEYTDKHFELVRQAIEAAFEIQDPNLLAITSVDEWRMLSSKPWLKDQQKKMTTSDIERITLVDVD